jgi:DnaJ-class molecular chaperone
MSDVDGLFGFRNENQSFVALGPMSGKMTSTRGGEGVAPDDCPNCGGSGYVAKPVDLNGKSEGVAFIRTKCPVCGGTGRKRSISPTTAG